MDDHKVLLGIGFGLVALWRIFTERKKYNWKKTFQFLAVTAIAAFGFFVMELAPVALSNTTMTALLGDAISQHSGLYSDKNGFLVEIGTEWYGIYDVSDDHPVVPILVWPTIIAFIGSVLIWLFDWRRGSADNQPSPANP